MLQTPAKNFPIKWYTLPWWFSLRHCLDRKSCNAFSLWTIPSTEDRTNAGPALKHKTAPAPRVSESSRARWRRHLCSTSESLEGILIHPVPSAWVQLTYLWPLSLPFSPNSWSAAALAATHKCHEEGHSSPGRGLADFPWWVPRPVLPSHISLTSQSSTCVEDAAQGRVGGISRRGKIQHCCEPAPNSVGTGQHLVYTGCDYLKFPDLHDTALPPLQTRPCAWALPQQNRIWFVHFWCCVCNSEWRNRFLFPGIYYKHSSRVRVIQALSWFVDAGIISAALLIQRVHTR